MDRVCQSEQLATLAARLDPDTKKKAVLILAKCERERQERLQQLRSAQIAMENEHVRQ